MWKECNSRKKGQTRRIACGLGLQKIGFKDTDFGAKLWFRMGESFHTDSQRNRSRTRTRKLKVTNKNNRDEKNEYEDIMHNLAEAYVLRQN